MTRNDFSQLLQKYLDGQCSESEQRRVESWFSLLDDEKRWQALPKEEIKAVEQRLWNRLQQSMHTEEMEEVPGVPVKKIFKLPVALRVAAAILLLLVGAAVLVKLTGTSGESVEPMANNWLTRSNDSKASLSFRLEDGSTITLSAGTTIRYPEHFTADKRELRVEGTAFFNIAKDSLRPFFVQSNDIMTRVLGTSFWVRYDKDRQQSAVEVVSGKVAVYKQTTDKKAPHAEGVVLKPNEKVIFNRREEVLITALVDTPVPVKEDSVQRREETMAFSYDETPLSAVVHDMEAEYGISIILGDEKLNGLQFTGNISSLDYYTKLKTICKSLGTTYEVRGNRILIQKR